MNQIIIAVIIIVLLSFIWLNKPEKFVHDIDRFSKTLEDQNNRKTLGRVMGQLELDQLLYETSNTEDLSVLFQMGANPKKILLETIKEYNDNIRDVMTTLDLIDEIREQLEEMINFGGGDDPRIPEMERNIARHTARVDTMNSQIDELTERAKIFIQAYLETRQYYTRIESTKALSRAEVLEVVLFLDEIDEIGLLEVLVKVDNLSKKKFTQKQQRNSRYAYAIDLIEDIKKYFDPAIISTLEQGGVDRDVARMVASQRWSF